MREHDGTGATLARALVHVANQPKIARCAAFRVGLFSFGFDSSVSSEKPAFSAPGKSDQDYG